MGRDIPIYAIPLLPLLGATINLLIGRRLSRRAVHVVAVSSVVAAFVIACFKIAGPLWDAWSAWSAGGRDAGAAATAGIHEHVYTWIQAGPLEIPLAFTLDSLSAVMVLVITFVGSLIHIYSTAYMAEDERYAAYFGYLNLFTGAMLILVLADNLPVMFIGWEGVGLCSYLLIGFWFDKTANANAGRKAFVVNRIGDFAFLLGMFLLFQHFKTLEFAELADERAGFAAGLWGDRVSTWAGILLFIGACGKSAQIPLYVWLPDAMAGPTPVSALIHAATMVTAGVYMVARMSFMYTTSAAAMAIVAGVGAITALVAALIAFAQTDFKKVLAYSTVSQLGFMFVGVGVGAYAAGIFHLVTHAFFKAGLFLAAGSVMHAMSGSGDITKMGGLRKKLPWTHFSMVIYCLAIAGIPIFSGFWSKDEILLGAFVSEGEGWWPLYGEALWLVLSLAAVGTAFYMWRLYFLVFAGECRADAETKSHIHESPRAMTVPLLVLAGFTCVLGVIGLPHLSAVSLPTYLHTWLSSSVTAVGPLALGANVAAPHASDALTLGLMAAATVLGGLGILVAYAMYRSGPSAAIDSFTARGFGRRLHRAVANKLYVDEIYEWIILKPFRWTANALWEVIDVFIIDTIFVRGSAFVVDWVGRMIRSFQNGWVQRYMAVLVIAAAVIFYLSGRSTAEFSYAPAGGNRVLFRANVGAGPGAHGAKVRWDFDSDGEIDAEGASVEHAFPKPERYRVTMRVTDGVFGHSTSVTHQVAVGGRAQ